MQFIFILLRSFIFNIVFMIWTITIAVIFLPLLFLPYVLSKRCVPIFWARSSLWLLKIICGVKYTIKHIENVPKESCIIASKHQSTSETLIFNSVLKNNVFILKKELIKLPLFGRYLLKDKSIVIDRQAGASALKKMVAQVRDRLEQGLRVIIFPEGTRTKPGESCDYLPGVSALYSRCNVPVVPVALNSGLFWAKNSFIKRPGTITIEFLTPIKPGLRRDQFETQLQQTIEDASNNLLKNL